jgi:hypothetical protein
MALDDIYLTARIEGRNASKFICLTNVKSAKN